MLGEVSSGQFSLPRSLLSLPSLSSIHLVGVLTPDQDTEYEYDTWPGLDWIIPRPRTATATQKDKDSDMDMDMSMGMKQENEWEQDTDEHGHGCGHGNKNGDGDKNGEQHDVSKLIAIKLERVFGEDLSDSEYSFYSKLLRSGRGDRDTVRDAFVSRFSLFSSLLIFCLSLPGFQYTDLVEDLRYTEKQLPPSYFLFLTALKSLQYLQLCTFKNMSDQLINIIATLPNISILRLAIDTREIETETETETRAPTHVHRDTDRQALTMNGIATALCASKKLQVLHLETEYIHMDEYENTDIKKKTWVTEKTPQTSSNIKRATSTKIKIEIV